MGSTNPTKLESVRMACSELFPSHSIEYKACSVKPGVSDQPKSAKESLLGATNRAKNTFTECPSADYCVGLEGGIESVGDHYLQSGWVVVINKEREIGFGTSA